MLRRTLTAAAVVLLAAGGLAACGDDNDGGGGSGGKKKVTLIQGIANEPFYISMECGAKEEAAARGVDLEVQAAREWDVAQQTRVVDAVAAKKPDAVLIAPVDKDRMANAVKQLQNKGSKVILVDTDLTDTSIGLSRISSDNKLGGKLGAQALAQQIGDKGKVLVLAPEPGIATTDERVAGFKEEMANHPDITVVSTEYPGDNAGKAQSLVAGKLAQHPDLAGIFASNLVTGEGSAAALKAAKKVGTVKLVEFDASPKQVDELKAGTIQALVSQQPLEIGRKGLQQAMNALEGKPVEKQLKTELSIVTKDNLEQADVAKYLYKATC